MVSTYSLKWTPACPGIHRDESASAMSAYGVPAGELIDKTLSRRTTTLRSLY
jgi:hypothetical protein